MSDNKDAAICDVVYNDDNIRKVIEQAPQTYNSILQHHKDNGSMQVVLRRRLSRLVKQQHVWKLRVPGTRFGLVLFCTPEHDYKILVSQGLTSVRIFYMYDFEDYDNHVVLNHYWELKGDGWSKWVYSNTPIKIKKYGVREGCYKLWE